MGVSSMFLSKIRPRRGDDEGAALALVIGLMFVGLLITSLIMAAIVGGIGFTSAARSGVESQAAADAGVAVAQAGLEAGTCGSVAGLYKSAAGAVPAYSAQVWRADSTGSWVSGCPIGSSTQVKIVSQGTTSAAGVAGKKGNDKSRVEAVYSIPVVVSGIAATGAAVYAYSSTGFGGSGHLISVGGSQPDVLVKTGNVSCSGSSEGITDLVVNNGTLNISGSCNVAGNAWASGRATLSGGVTVAGNLVANGITISSGTVTKSAWSTLDLTMSGGSALVSQNATAKSLSMTGSARILGSAWIYGASSVSNSTIAGNLTTKTKSGTGATIGSTTIIAAGPGTSPYIAAAAPTVPDWVDFKYVQADWVGFGSATISGTCTTAQIVAAIATMNTGPGVLDARGCTNGFVLGGADKLTLKKDLAIIANKFALSGSAGLLSSGATRVWMINPDTTADNAPTCASGNSFSISGAVEIDPKIAYMIYSPCKVDIASSIHFNGQIFGGQVSLNGSGELGYVKVGLPGYDLTTGISTSAGATGGSNLTMVSQRNVTVG